MKKTVLALLLSCVFLFPGCSYEKYEMGSEIKVSYLTVEPDDWYNENTQAGSYWSCRFRMDDITSDVIENGAVIAYFIDTRKGTDNVLPYVYPIRVNGQEYDEILLQNIRFNIEKGFIKFIAEWSDGTKMDIQEKYEFKVCVIYPVNSERRFR